MMVSMRLCFYLLRTLNKSTFIAFIDVDEIIVPRIASSLTNLVEKYTNTLAYKCGLLIRNVVFRRECSSDPTFVNDPSVLQYNIITLLTTKRETLKPRGSHRNTHITKVQYLLVLTFRIVINPGLEGSHRENACALLHHHRFRGDPVINGDSVNVSFLFR